MAYDIAPVEANVLDRPPPDRWFVPYLPVTGNNDITIYIDGQDYCSDLHAALTAATEEICLTGLHFSGHFRLLRGAGGPEDDADDALQKVLAERSRAGVKIYLIVNQFWPNEGRLVTDYHRARRDLDKLVWKMPNPIRGTIMAAGGLADYLPKTHAFFEYLKSHGTAGNIKCYCDIHQGYFMHSNHQKTVIVDRKVAFLGGIDLTDIDGDRWDARGHPANDARRNFDKPERNWHDIHMRLKKSDAAKVSAVDYVYANFLARYNHGYFYQPRLDGGELVSDKRTATDLTVDGRGPRDYVEKKDWIYPHQRLHLDPPPAEPVLQIVRSMPVGNKDNYKKRQRPLWNRCKDERFEHSARDAYLLGIRSARKFIYLENQWIADKKIWAALIEAAKARAGQDDFRILIVLPKKFLAAAGYGSEQAMDLYPYVKQIARIFRAAGKPEHFGLFSLLQPDAHRWTDAEGAEQRRRHWQIPEAAWDYSYVHSKVMVIDDCWLLVGSANAGGISLTGVLYVNEPDTELSAIILDERDESQVKEFRKRVWAEMLEVEPADVDDYQAGADLFHTRGKEQDYDSDAARKVHYNVLYYPYSAKAIDPTNVGPWRHLKWEQITKQLDWRINHRDEFHQTYHNLSGPLTAAHMLLGRDPGRYKKMVKDLYQHARSKECKLDVRKEDLLEAAIEPEHPILELDWMVGGAMIDSTNWILDYEGTVSETVASVTYDKDMITYMEDLIPCKGGVRPFYCVTDGDPESAVDRANAVLRDARLASVRLRDGEKNTVFVAVKIKPSLLLEMDADAVKAHKGDDGFDLGDPRWWISRIDDNPFLKLERDRGYPLYPGVLTPYDVKHVLPAEMFVRMTEPVEFTVEANRVTHVTMTFWTWGKVSKVRFPVWVFARNVLSFFVGYYTREAYKRAEGTVDADTADSGKVLRKGKVKEYVHEDIDVSDVRVESKIGAVQVELSRRVWWSWEHVETRTVQHGEFWKTTVGEASSVFDQDLRVRLKAVDDCVYDIAVKSYD